MNKAITEEQQLIELDILLKVFLVIKGQMIFLQPESQDHLWEIINHEKETEPF